jgi:hypothetical protein
MNRVPRLRPMPGGGERRPGNRREHTQAYRAAPDEPYAPLWCSERRPACSTAQHRTVVPVRDEEAAGSNPVNPTSVSAGHQRSTVPSEEVQEAANVNDLLVDFSESTHTVVNSAELGGCVALLSLKSHKTRDNASSPQATVPFRNMPKVSRSECVSLCWGWASS